MEAEGAVPLIKFWLAVENFRLSAQTMVEQQQQQATVAVDESPAKQPNTSIKCDIEDRPLTDDEKSEMMSSSKSEKKPPVSKSKRNSQFQTTVATDALKILEKFLCSTSESWIDIPATIHSKISLSMCNCDESTSLVAPDCFSEAQEFVLDRLEREYLKRFLDSEFYCKYSLEILTGGDLRREDILYSESALFYFMEFLEQQQEQPRDYLDFLLSATNFRRHSAGALDASVASGDAMVLYEKYFSLQATSSLGFSDAVRSQVEERICATEEKVLIGCFDLPIRVVERFFKKVYLERFLASDLFFKHVTDLVNRSQAQSSERQYPKGVTRTQSLTGGGRSHRKINSEGENFTLKRSKSTFSISSLVAANGKGEEQPTHQVAKLGSTVELRIDSRMFCNGSGGGEKQSSSGGSTSSLSFGRVNALGRFERDLGLRGAEEGGCAEREESAGSRLKKAVKKFVNLSEDKVQEELAWQVAEMIVKDVTDITMNGGGRGGGVNGESRRNSVMVVEEEE